MSSLTLRFLWPQLGKTRQSQEKENKPNHIIRSPQLSCRTVLSNDPQPHFERFKKKKKKEEKKKTSLASRFPNGFLITLSASRIGSPGPRVSDLLSANRVFLKTRKAVSSRLGDPGLGCLGFAPPPPPPFLQELRALPPGSHHLPLFSLSLALISPMCNESYLKPTKTSPTSLAQVQRGVGGTGGRRRVCKGGRPGEARGARAPFQILRCAFPGPRPRPSRERPPSQLQAQPPGFCFVNCLFKENLLGHPERTRGEGERELSPAA